MFRSGPRKRKINTKSKKKMGRRRLENAANAATALAQKARDEWHDQRASRRSSSDEDYCISDQEEEHATSDKEAAAEPIVFKETFMMSSRASIGLQISDGKTCIPPVQQLVRTRALFRCDTQK